MLDEAGREVEEAVMGAGTAQTPTWLASSSLQILLQSVALPGWFVDARHEFCGGFYFLLALGLGLDHGGLLLLLECLTCLIIYGSVGISQNTGFVL